MQNKIDKDGELTSWDIVKHKSPMPALATYHRRRGMD